MRDRRSMLMFPRCQLTWAAWCVGHATLCVACLKCVYLDSGSVKLVVVATERLTRTTKLSALLARPAVRAAPAWRRVRSKRACAAGSWVFAAPLEHAASNPTGRQSSTLRRPSASSKCASTHERTTPTAIALPRRTLVGSRLLMCCPLVCMAPCTCFREHGCTSRDYPPQRG